MKYFTDVGQLFVDKIVKFDHICENVEFGTVQKYVIFIASRKLLMSTSIYSQKSPAIQPRTSPPE